MNAPRYPDSLIDRAIEQAASPYWHRERPNKRKIEKCRAEMIRLRDEAGPRVGAEPSAADLQWALNLRAKDLLGLSDSNGFYQDSRS